MLPILLITQRDPLIRDCTVVTLPPLDPFEDEEEYGAALEETLKPLDLYQFKAVICDSEIGPCIKKLDSLLPASLKRFILFQESVNHRPVYDEDPTYFFYKALNKLKNPWMGLMNNREQVPELRTRFPNLKEVKVLPPFIYDHHWFKDRSEFSHKIICSLRPDEDPVPMVRAFLGLASSMPDFQFELYGIDLDFFSPEPDLVPKNLKLGGYLEHDELLEKLAQAMFLYEEPDAPFTLTSYEMVLGGGVIIKLNPKELGYVMGFRIADGSGVSEYSMEDLNLLEGDKHFELIHKIRNFTYDPEKILSFLENADIYHDRLLRILRDLIGETEEAPSTGPVVYEA